jgi:hypothetical protein
MWKRLKNKLFVDEDYKKKGDKNTPASVAKEKDASDRGTS